MVIIHILYKLLLPIYISVRIYPKFKLVNGASRLNNKRASYRRPTFLNICLLKKNQKPCIMYSLLCIVIYSQPHIDNYWTQFFCYIVFIIKFHNYIFIYLKISFPCVLDITYNLIHVDEIALRITFSQNLTCQKNHDYFVE